MTPTELRALILASGLSNSEFARRVPVNRRSLTRMLAGEIAITDRMAASVRRMLGAADAPPSEWPRDEWIIGEGPPPERREYIIHTTAPRFIARIVAIDELTDLPEPDEEPADTLSGVTYAHFDNLICEITWLDAAPADPTALTRLLDRAANQLSWDA